MTPIKICLDKVANTLSVWFDDPRNEHVSEETVEEVVLVKNAKGKVIGFEILNYLSPEESEDVTRVDVESEVVG